MTLASGRFAASASAIAPEAIVLADALEVAKLNAHWLWIASPPAIYLDASVDIVVANLHIPRRGSPPREYEPTVVLVGSRII